MLANYYITLFVIALVATWWIFKKVLRIALLKNITDNPNARKSQKVPVPLLGGAVVFFGMIVAMTFTRLTVDTNSLFAIMGVMTIMLYTGTMDDILSLSPRSRFLIEIMVVLLLIYSNGYSINNFHGLWGIHQIPQWIAVPLTIFACVGIINSINFIDGVNGLSSGYCIITCLAFGSLFIIYDDKDAASMAVLAVGALIPFFCHNVFGKRSRMYIGDGGTLLMGTLISTFVIGLLNADSPVAAKIDPDLGLIPFTLAVLALPVFDCLRVITARIMRGVSPFSADRNHLHHLLIDMNFSHVGTTAVELLATLGIIGIWYLSYMIGASVDVQLYVVIALGFLATFGFDIWLRRQRRLDTKTFRRLRSVADSTHVSHTPWFEKFRNFLDRGC